MTNQISDLSFTLNPEAAVSFHDDGVVILHIGEGRLFGSNATGARIWHGIERRLSFEVIAEEISGEYNIALSDARRDTAHFLAELERRKLIRREARV